MATWMRVLAGCVPSRGVGDGDGDGDGVGVGVHNDDVNAIDAIYNGAELQRLQVQKFLTPRQAEAVDAEKILALFSSELGNRILHADSLRREFKFSILVPASGARIFCYIFLKYFFVFSLFFLQSLVSLWCLCYTIGNGCPRTKKE